MDFRSLLQSFNTIAEAEGTVHKGTYGTSYGKEDVRDQYGHRVGKVDKEAGAKKDEPKKGRGRPKKDGGEGAKFDTSALSAAFGSKKPSGKVGTVSKKHSLKEYIDELEVHTLTESQIEEAVSRKDFRMVAELIRNIEDPAKRAELAQHHAQIFQQQNPRFSPDKFYAAVGVDPRLAEEELTIKPMPGASQIVDPQGETIGTADAQTAAVMKNAAAKGTLNIGQQMKEGKKAKPDFIDADKDGNEKESMKKAFKDKEARKKKVDESLSFNEMSQEAQAEAQEMLAELQDDIENFVNTGHCSEKLEAFLKVHGHAKKKITDEGSIQDFTTHGMDSKPSKFVAVDPAQKPTPWKVDPIQATTDRAISGAQKAGSFIKNLVAPKKTFEGTTMKDIQVESWEKQLNGLLTEGITVSSSQGQQGAPDSVSVTANDADAQQLLAVLRQAGLGVFGGGEQPTSNYGAPMAAHGEEPEGHGTEPEASPEVADVDDDIMSLIKKMTGIEQGGEQPGTLEPADGGEEEHGQDYEDEEGSEESGEEQGSEEESGEEEQTDEGNAFTGKLAQTKQGGEFKLGDKEYKDTSSLEEEDMEEGNMFTGNLAKARAQGKEQADLDNDGDMEKVREGEDACEACGQSPCGCDHEQVEENYANEPNEELAKLKALLSMGNDMHRMKQSQAVGNPVRVAESNMINDWKKLSGIK